MTEDTLARVKALAHETNFEGDDKDVPDDFYLRYGHEATFGDLRALVREIEAGRELVIVARYAANLSENETVRRALSLQANICDAARKGTE